MPVLFFIARIPLILSRMLEIYLIILSNIYYYQRCFEIQIDFFSFTVVKSVKLIYFYDQHMNYIFIPI